MRYPANAPKPFFSFPAKFYTVWLRIKEIPVSKIGVFSYVLLTSLAALSVIGFERSCRKRKDIIETVSGPLMRKKQEDRTNDLAPFTSPFRSGG